jgi:hypothetical protein
MLRYSFFEDIKKKKTERDMVMGYWGRVVMSLGVLDLEPMLFKMMRIGNENDTIITVHSKQLYRVKACYK